MKNKIPALCALVFIPAAHAANFAAVATKGESIGTTYLFDGNASTGGGDFDTTGTPETGFFTRTWSLASPGGGGVDVSVTGLAFGVPPASNTNGNVITATITYLGADGVAGGTDDVVLGNTTATLVLTTASRYEWLFDTPITGNIDGANSVFIVRLESREADNGGSTLNMRFKTTSGTLAASVKMDVAGTSSSKGLVDLDADGIHDAFETGTGIYVNALNTGTSPANPDTDGDGLLDGVENNTGTFVSASRTGTSPVNSDTDGDGLLDGAETTTSPLNRDQDNDRLSDGYEVANGLNPLLNADFDNDGFSDALEVLFYGSDPKLNTSFPGDGTHPAPGSFTPIQNAGAATIVGNTAGNLGDVIVDEAATGGDVDADFTTGLTSFALHYDNLFPAAGSSVSLTGFAWPVVLPINASGDILVQFFDPGADGKRSIDRATLVGSAKGTLTVTGATTVMYWNFPAPINFTSAGTGLIVKIQSTAALRIKAQNQGNPAFARGIWYTNDGRNTFGTLRSSRISLGGTVIAPLLPKFLTINRVGTTTTLTWDLNGVPSVTLQRSTTLLPGSFENVTNRTNTTETSYSEVSADPKAFFRLATP